MGFDIYGMNPQLNEEYAPRYDEIMKEYGTGDGFLDWQKEIPQEVKDEYYELKDKFEENNPGVYFRNNVWFWRPLWDFVIDVCEDYLSDEEIHGGFTNDGVEISEETAILIANKLDNALDNGYAISMAEAYDEKNAVAKAHNAEIEEKLEKLKRTVDAFYKNNKNHEKYDAYKENPAPVNYPEDLFAIYKNISDSRDWNSNYPFSIENIHNFSKFCRQSGGFQIC